jgi:hypothetical protein
LLSHNREGEASLNPLDKAKQEHAGEAAGALREMEGRGRWRGRRSVMEMPRERIVEPRLLLKGETDDAWRLG